MSLYPFQREAVNGIYKSLRTHDRSILQCPTGSGKTHMAMDIIKHGLRHNRRINFIVDRITLVDQTLEKFYENQIPVSVMQGQHPMYNPDKPVNIISAQTLARRDPRHWPEANLFLVDECHDQYQIVYDVMERWNALKYIGLSATPFTRGLGLHWDDLVVGATTAELIEQGYLSPYVAYGVSNPDMTGVRARAGDWVADAAAERMSPLTGDIVAHWKAHAPDEKTLVFATNVAHAQSLAQEFRNQGITADYVCGRDSDSRRKEVLDAYSRGDIKVLTNCQVLTKGYDQPDITCGIIARPTKSLALHIQMLGRLLRTHPDKERALILDHAANVTRLGFPDDELPTRLDMGEHTASETDQRPQEEPQPWTCGGCKALVPPRTRACPVCGQVAQREHGVEVQSGVLQQLGMPSRAGQQEVQRMLNFIAANKGYQSGWAFHAYKKLFNAAPRNFDKSIIKPTPELESWAESYISDSKRAYAIRRSYANRGRR